MLKRKVATVIAVLVSVRPGVKHRIGEFRISYLAFLVAWVVFPSFGVQVANADPLLVEDVRGDIDKFAPRTGQAPPECGDPDWIPVEGPSGCVVTLLPEIPETACNEDATDGKFSLDLTLCFDFDVGIVPGIVGAYVEFWGLDIDHRTVESFTLDQIPAQNQFDFKHRPPEEPDDNDYVTLSKYILTPTELQYLHDGTLSVELFSQRPQPNEDTIAFDFVRLVVEYDPTIPTVSEWGLVVTTLLVLSAGTVVLMRRRAAA